MEIEMEKAMSGMDEVRNEEIALRIISEANTVISKDVALRVKITLALDAKDAAHAKQVQELTSRAKGWESAAHNGAEEFNEVKKELAHWKAVVEAARMVIGKAVGAAYLEYLELKESIKCLDKMSK